MQILFKRPYLISVASAEAVVHAFHQQYIYRLLQPYVLDALHEGRNLLLICITHRLAHTKGPSVLMFTIDVREKLWALGIPNMGMHCRCLVQTTLLLHAQSPQQGGRGRIAQDTASKHCTGKNEHASHCCTSKSHATVDVALKCSWLLGSGQALLPHYRKAAV